MVPNCVGLLGVGLHTLERVPAKYGQKYMSNIVLFFLGAGAGWLGWMLLSSPPRVQGGAQ